MRWLWSLLLALLKTSRQGEVHSQIFALWVLSGGASHVTRTPTAAFLGEYGPTLLQVKLDAQALLDIASLPDALALGSLPELTNPFTPLKNALDPVQEATTGLIDSVSSLKDILGG